jgi:hypothetical protein
MGSESFFIHPIQRHLYRVWSVLSFFGLNVKAPCPWSEHWGVFAFLGCKTSKLSLRLSIFVVLMADKFKEINLSQR